MIEPVRAYQKFRYGVGARLAVILALVALLSGLGTAGLLYFQDRREIEDAIVEELLGIGRTTAAGISGNLHDAAIGAPVASTSAGFKTISRWLRRIKSENHLSTDIYTVVENGDGNLVFGVMSNERPFAGDRYPEWARSDLVREVLATGSARGSGVYRDENGTWLSSFSPVRDGEGRVRAVLEVDRRADDFLTRLRRRAGITFAVSLLAALAAALLGLISSRRISIPLRKLSEATESMASGLDVDAPVIRRRDEIGRLSRGFSIMVRNLRDRDAEVERLTLGLVAALEHANSEKDSDTGQHLRRVAAYSVLLAQEAQLAPDLIRKIESFAPLHDVGKVGVPDEIIRKPGRLTEKETRTMRRHVRFGAEILEAAGVDIVARNICLYHHEHWDGNGYLEGISGEQIPVEARIVAIADVYDALTTVRPYKRAFAHAEAFQVMKEGAGSHFDPDLFEIFARNIGRIDAIRETLSVEECNDCDPPATYLRRNNNVNSVAE